MFHYLWNMVVVDWIPCMGRGVRAETHAWLRSNANMYNSAAECGGMLHWAVWLFTRRVNQCLNVFVGVWDIQAGETNQMVHMNILITCVFAAFLMGALLAGLIVFCYRDSFLRKPRHVHKDTESAPSCTDSTGSFVKLNGLFDSPVKVQL